MTLKAALLPYGTSSSHLPLLATSCLDTGHWRLDRKCLDNVSQLLPFKRFLYEGLEFWLIYVIVLSAGSVLGRCTVTVRCPEIAQKSNFEQGSNAWKYFYKDAGRRALASPSGSRRDPAEGRVNFSPAVGAGLKPSVLVEEPARTGREGRRPSPTSSAPRFASKPPTGAKSKIPNSCFKTIDFGEIWGII